MDSVFVDSNVFIGILNAHDALHERSVALWKKLQERQYRVVLSHFIVSEVVTVLSYRSHKQDALYFAQSIYFDNNHEVDIVRLDETLELRALEVMRSASSKNISFVDASNIAIMETYGIKQIASFDKMFRTYKNIEVLS